MLKWPAFDQLKDFPENQPVDRILIRQLLADELQTTCREKSAQILADTEKALDLIESPDTRQVKLGLSALMRLWKAVHTQDQTMSV